MELFGAYPHVLSGLLLNPGGRKSDITKPILSLAA